jgi:hypothetical protein
VGFPQEITVTSPTDNKTVTMAGYSAATAAYIKGSLTSSAPKKTEASFQFRAHKAGEALTRTTIRNMVPLRIDAFYSGQTAGDYTLMLPPNNYYDIYLVTDYQDESHLETFTIRGKLNNVATGGAGSESLNNNFTYANEGGTVTGTVTYNNQPVLAAHVTLEDSSGNLIAGGETDQTGVYRIYNVPAGSYTAYAWEPQKGESPAFAVNGVTDAGTVTVNIEYIKPLIKYVSPGKYPVAENLKAGDVYYIDRTYTLTEVPSELSIASWIKTGNADKTNTSDSFLSFTLMKDAMVYVAYDSRATSLPNWLSGFTNTGLTLKTTDVTLKIYAKFYSAGKVTLGGNLAAGAAGAGTNYLVIAKESASLPFIQYVQPSKYPVAENLNVGSQYYIDRTYTLTEVPSELTVASWIKTGNADKTNTSESFLTFSLTRDAMVYVAYDSRATSLPNWLSEFTNTGSVLKTTDVQLKIYAKFCSAGKVTLGGNMAAGAAGAGTNYVVIIQEPAALALIKYVSPGKYLVADNLTVGSPYYIDRTYTITELPSELGTASWIKTGNAEKTNTSDSFLTFTLTKDSMVYIAYDSRAASLPNWLSSFTNTGLVLKTTDVQLKIYAKLYPAGKVILGGNLAAGAAGAATNYVVAVKDGASLARIKYISPSKYPAADDLKAGDTYYIDRTYTLTEVPSELSAASWIKTGNAEKTNASDTFLTFTLTQDSFVYVAYDSRAASLPNWLSGFTNTGLVLKTSDVQLKIYTKFYPAGQIVLGGNLAAGAAGANTNYVVIAK